MATTTNYTCEHCGRGFAREQSLGIHVCEQKRRHLERDERGVQMGLHAWLRFYETLQGSSRLKTWEDFVRSPYYRAFVKFGRYCQGTRVIDGEAYLAWLLATNRKLDHWCRDSLYDEFLVHFLITERADAAVRRAQAAATKWHERTGHPAHDYVRFGNVNEICFDITAGRLSAWCLYNSDSGSDFLSNLLPHQVEMIWPYVDSEVWQRCFEKNATDRIWVEEYLREQGW